MADSEKTLTFVEHLEELRTRLIVCLAAWLGLTMLSLPLAPKAIALLTRPLAAATQPDNAPTMTLKMEPVGDGEEYRIVGVLENVESDADKLDAIAVEIELPNGERRPIGEGARTGSSFYYSNIMDPVWLLFKTALILGIILALPVWVYQIWAFVAPGLRESEKAVIRPLFGMGIVLFPLGALFAYFLLRMIVGFLLSFDIERVSPLLNYPNYATFALRIMTGFGVLFEIPAAIMVLARLGVVTPRQLREYRPYAYVILAVIAMLVTPPEPISMLAVLGPIYLLYELSVHLAQFMQRRSAESTRD